jgi:hypothetical protein
VLKDRIGLGCKTNLRKVLVGQKQSCLKNPQHNRFVIPSYLVIKPFKKILRKLKGE